MRPISIGFPSGKITMILWEDTEDEEAFPVRCAKRGNPYVEAYGVKYELTKEETNFIKGVLATKKGCIKP